MKLGIFLPHIGYSQNAVTAISYMNSMIIKHEDIYPSIFIKEIEMSVVKPRTLVTSADKLYNYDGHVITTNLDTTYIALNCKRLQSINFYVAELEWTFKVGNYMSNISIYRNAKVNLICPSIDYANALKNYCNVTVEKVIPGLNIYEIATTIRTRNTSNV